MTTSTVSQTRQIKESVRKVDDLENNLVKEREIFNLKNITLRDLEAELESLLLKEVRLVAHLIFARICS